MYVCIYLFIYMYICVYANIDIYKRLLLGGLHLEKEEARALVQAPPPLTQGPLAPASGAPSSSPQLKRSPAHPSPCQKEAQSLA